MTNGANQSDLITNIQSGPVGCIEPVWIPTTYLETATSGGNTQVHTVTSSSHSRVTSFLPDTSCTNLSSTTLSAQQPGDPSVTGSQPDPSAIRVSSLGSGPVSAVTTTNNTPSPSSSSSMQTPDFSDGVFQTSRAPSSTPSMTFAVVTSTLTMLTTTTGFPCSLCNFSTTTRGL